MAKFEYQLSPNESIIMKSDHVYHGKEKGELILTNINLVHVTAKGMLKNNYITQRYPINQIKVFNGNAQVILGKSGNIDFYFMNGQESFRFWNDDTFFSDKKAENEAANWVSAINQLLTGTDAGINNSTKTTVIGTEMIADAIGGTVNAFKGALGFKAKNSSAEQIEKTARKCSFCGASISGNTGQIVRCSYCDADQQL